MFKYLEHDELDFHQLYIKNKIRLIFAIGN